MRALAIAAALLSTSFAPANADVLFTEDFEGTLSQWVGKNGGAHHGAIVSDPLSPANNVVVFTALNAAGDIYGNEVPVSASAVYTLSFDYLGYPQAGSPPGSFGGFIGIADESDNPLNASTVRFLAGTAYEQNILVELVDDGAWHSYSVVFNPYSLVTVTDDAIRITVEDWIGESSCTCPTGVPGDAFFDNIKLERTDPLTTESTTWGRLKALYR